MRVRVKKGLKIIYCELTPAVVFDTVDNEPSKWFSIKDKDMYSDSDIDAIYEHIKNNFDSIMKALDYERLDSDRYDK